ncbi:hypothetical protein C9925_01055 [cyanobacterium G8-9]|nr:hypothetical protein C9925_01055 [cyanobacterium G8-9]
MIEEKKITDLIDVLRLPYGKSCTEIIALIENSLTQKAGENKKLTDIETDILSALEKLTMYTTSDILSSVKAICKKRGIK